MSAPKKSKVEATAGSASDKVPTLQKLADIQEELTGLEKEHLKEIEKLELQFAKRREKVFDRRREISKNVPSFWLTAFQNHRLLSDLIAPREVELLEALHDVRVTMHGDDRLESLKVTMTFGPNAYLEQSSITKEIAYPADDDQGILKLQVIKWKAGKDLTKAAPAKGKAAAGKKRAAAEEDEDEDGMGLFKFFSDDDLEATMEVMDALKTVVNSAFDYYMGAVSDDEDDIEGFEFGSEEDDDDDEEDDDEDDE